MSHRGYVWQSYTPTWSSQTSSPSLGNGTLTGQYIHVGDVVHLDVYLEWGSTTTMGTDDHYLTLPVAPGSGDRFELTAVFKDVTYPHHYFAIVKWDAGNSRIEVIQDANSITFGGSNVWDHDTPFTPATGDWMHITGWYRA